MAGRAFVDVGPGVGTLTNGDHVIPLYTQEYRQGKFCLSRKTDLCQAIRSVVLYQVK